MTQRTFEEREEIRTKVVQTLISERRALTASGNHKAADALVEFMCEANTDSFVRFYDILRSA